MNEKPNVSSRGARRSARSAIPSAQGEREVPSDATRARTKPGRSFHNRQARTDAAIRTIPGLHNFGN